MILHNPIVCKHACACACTCMLIMVLLTCKCHSAYVYKYIHVHVTSIIIYYLCKKFSLAKTAINSSYILFKFVPLKRFIIPVILIGRLNLHVHIRTRTCKCDLSSLL